MSATDRVAVGGRAATIDWAILPISEGPVEVLNFGHDSPEARIAPRPGRCTSCRRLDNCSRAIETYGLAQAALACPSRFLSEITPTALPLVASRDIP